ncbi:hypothetical protein DdX_09420 [Ditylenchus destructor]|uniref:Uncharacterized protein n=1 Tax=Ditylenchus destructor TaxID=166010 RepID=A0AAD4N2T7_9BILA|nr:hypothetical protein DdX_09420 [Ditylenchus destructor]
MKWVQSRLSRDSTTGGGGAHSLGIIKNEERLMVERKTGPFEEAGGCLGLGIRCGVAREHTYAEEKDVWSGRGEDGKEEQDMGQSVGRRATPN